MRIEQTCEVASAPEAVFDYLTIDAICRSAKPR